MSKHPKVSIIIPSFQRPESLEECLISIRSQTFTDYEILVRGEEGPLAKIRNSGAREAKGDILIFIDDDVICSPGWLKSIIQIFDSRLDIGGVSGPSIITKLFRRKRD